MLKVGKRKWGDTKKKNYIKYCALIIKKYLYYKPWLKGSFFLNQRGINKYIIYIKNMHRGVKIKF
jgi:hypothetical protein